MFIAALIVAALSTAAVAVAGPGNGGIPGSPGHSGKATGTFTASYYNQGMGGTYTCTGTRFVKPGSKGYTKDVETCTLSDLSFPAGTYVATPGTLGPTWCSVAVTQGAVYYNPDYPPYAAGTTKCGIDVSGQPVPWIWYTDSPAATPNGGVATNLTLTVSDNGDSTGTLNVVAYY